MSFRQFRDYAFWLFAILAFVLFMAGVMYLNFMYHNAGYENCKANGSSAVWCLATHEWQSFKALFF